MNEREQVLARELATERIRRKFLDRNWRSILSDCRLDDDRLDLNRDRERVDLDRDPPDDDRPDDEGERADLDDDIMRQGEPVTPPTFDPRALYSRTDLAAMLGRSISVESFLDRLRIPRRFKNVVLGSDIVRALEAPPPLDEPPPVVRTGKPGRPRKATAGTVADFAPMTRDELQTPASENPLRPQSRPAHPRIVPCAPSQSQTANGNGGGHVPACGTSATNGRGRG